MKWRDDNDGCRIRLRIRGVGINGCERVIDDNASLKLDKHKDKQLHAMT